MDAPLAPTSTTGADAIDNPFALMDPEMLRHPQPVLNALRESAPVLAVDGMGVMLNRRDLIDEAFRKPEVFSSNMSAVDLCNVRPLIPLQIDPPQHKSYRKILDPLFAPREMVKLEDAFAARVNALIDGFIERGSVDFAQEFSIPFPSLAFLSLLGLPADELRAFLRMKDGIIRPDSVIGAPREDPATKAYQREIANSIYEYFERVIDERSAQRQDDLISRFLDTEVDGERLTREEILDICFLFLIAGLDTVTATLDCMFGFFVEHPEHRREIVEDPSLIPAAVEELLRWETPVMTVVRVAMEDTEIGGCPVSAGDHVMAMLSSANLDNAEFDDGDVVRFDREANRHIAFGVGVHRCLGSHLARTEVRIALREWHRRIPEYALAEGAELDFTPAIRSVEHFPMVFPAGSAEG
jgi:cytochrome P450